LRRLREDKLDVDRVLETGQLVVWPTEAMVSFWEAASVDWERTITQRLAGIADAITDACAEGYDHVRLTNEPAAGLHRPVKLLCHGDQLAHELLLTHPATWLCQYERRHWSPSELEELGRSHSVKVVAPSLYDDELLRVTRCGPFSLRFAGEIDYSNREPVRTMIERELQQALRATPQPEDVQIHLQSLRFADVTSVTQLIHTVDNFPKSQQLVLQNAQPRIRRLFDRCGAASNDQLVIRETPN